MQLRAELSEAKVLIAELRAEIEKLRSEKGDSPPPFVKPNTPKLKDQPGKGQRRKRAKEQNGARPRDIPTQTLEHKQEECPTCAYPLRYPRLSGRRQVIELPPPQPVQITEHQLFKSWCARCRRWHHAHVDLSGQVVGQSRIGTRIASLIAYLRTSLRLPVALVKEYLHTVQSKNTSTRCIISPFQKVRYRD